MRLEPLYRLSLAVEDEWTAGGRRFALLAGSCEGALAGRFRGAEERAVRPDGVVVTEVQGFVDVGGEEGAGLVAEIRGLARPRPEGALEVVAAATHLSDDPRFARLNDVVCAAEGSWRPQARGLELTVFECVWEPVAE